LAVVYHAVPPNRLQRSYFLDWWFDKSRADIRAFGIPADARWFIARIPLYMFRRLVMWTLRWMVALERRQRFGAKLNVWAIVAEIGECYRLSRDARRTAIRTDR